MTNPNLTLIAALLDRSGSMQRIKDDTEGGFTSFLAEQDQQPGILEVTLAQFDDEYEVVYAPTTVADRPTFTLHPRGRTALLDAVGRFVTEVGQILAARPEQHRPGTVLVVIMTDGRENASREWTLARVRELITQQQDQYSWRFLFLGANLDAVHMGGELGIARGQTITYGANTIGTYSVMDSVSRVATDARAGRPTAFTDAQREAAMGTGQ